jgi:hypothetical protein
MSDGDRDAWCTPEWLTALLPEVDLDPCSNERSTVRSRARYMLPAQDGLRLPWFGSVFTNPPFSNILPWADCLVTSANVTAAGFLVNVDTSTSWWRLLTSRLTHGLFFYKRIPFNPPPGVKPSTNSKPQALLMDSPFLSMCSNDLLSMGAMWSVHRRAA